MEPVYVPPVSEINPPPPPIELTPEEKRKVLLIRIIHSAGPILQKIYTGLKRFAEDVIESILRH